MSLLRMRLFETKGDFIKWADNLAQAVRRKEAKVEEIGIGTRAFKDVEEFAAWARALPDEEWGRLHDEWVKFGPKSPKQQS